MVTRKGAVGVAVVLCSLLLNTVAQAGISDLALLLRSPIGRFLLRESDELGSISSQLIGQAAKSDDAVRALTSRLAASENAGLATQLEGRLNEVRKRLMMEATLREVDDVAGAVRRLGSELFAGNSSGSGAFQFVDDVATAERFEQIRARFVGAAQEGGNGFTTSAAGRDFNGLRVGELKGPGGDLRFADFQDVIAGSADLKQARLEFSNLSRAQLPGAELAGSTLDHAVADGANLRRAIFRDASLQGASLRGANLTNADLMGADLRGADLTDVVIRGFGFSNKVSANLKNAVFNAQTRLPFSLEEAERLGMIFVP